MVYIYSGILVIKKYEILPFVITWMNLKSIIIIELSQREKDKNCMISLTVGN